MRQRLLMESATLRRPQCLAGSSLWLKARGGHSPG